MKLREQRESVIITNEGAHRKLDLCKKNQFFLERGSLFLDKGPFNGCPSFRELFKQKTPPVGEALQISTGHQDNSGIIYEPKEVAASIT